MTMDVSHNKKHEVKGDVILTKSEDLRTELPVRAKRSFDVAFLMLPDEKLKRKEEAAKITKYSYEETLQAEDSSVAPDSDEDEEIEVDKIEYVKMQGKYYSTQRQQIFGDPNLGKADFKPKLGEQKSAFTKVSLKDTSRLSPNLSISPDLSYQNSLSPSPPNRNYPNYQQSASVLSPNHLFKSHNMPASYQSQFDGFPQENPFIIKSPNGAAELLQPNFSKLRSSAAAGVIAPQYRPEMAYNYAAQFQPQEMMKPAAAAEIRNPAAAILSSLLPPSLAALSLPTQNVCAKCNISFRMTSDLVYHMRSHHKNDNADYTRKKREDKLKCPVCAESFRERHHLTRHMTAHQDKDNDEQNETALNKKKQFALHAHK